MVENSQSPVETVEVQPTTGPPLKPHRGGLVLALGILGIVCCFICGIIAWVFGSNDLKEMAAGTMDPSGKGMTQAGKICGIISVVLQIVGLVIWLLMMIIGGAGAAMSQ